MVKIRGVLTGIPQKQSKPRGRSGQYASITVELQLLSPGTDPISLDTRSKHQYYPSRGQFVYQYPLGLVRTARTEYYTLKLRILVEGSTLV